MTMRRTFAASLLSTAFMSAFAATLALPSTTVSAASGGGVNFTVMGNFVAADTISAAASGTVDLASGRFTSNAAGIITAPATTNTANHPGQVSPNTSIPSENYGALLIGNSTLGFFRLFPSNAANGLGSATPPTSLSTTARLGSIFGAGFSGVTNGTVLTLEVSDCSICFDDNSGSFTVGPDPPTVPEPVSGLLVTPVLAALIFASRRRRVTAGR